MKQIYASQEQNLLLTEINEGQALENNHSKIKTQTQGLINSIVKFIHPTSIKESGQKRLVSLDFLRGIAIFVMLAGHELQETAAGDAQNNPVFFIVGVPLALTAGFRTFFIMISGIAHSFVFGSTIFGKSFKQALTGLFMSIFGSFMALPLFYFFHVCNVMTYDFQNGVLNMGQPWYKGLSVYSHPPIFFGFSQPINAIVMLLLYLMVIYPFTQVKKLRQYHVMFIAASLCFIVSVILPFVFMPIANSLRTSMAKSIDINPDQMTGALRECPGNYFGPVSTTFQEHLRNIFYHFNAGNYMQMNCQYMFFMMGLSIGFVLSAFKVHKSEILNSHNTQEQIKKDYLQIRRKYLMYFSFSPLIILALEFAIIAQVNSQLKSGVRSFKFDFAAFVSKQIPNDCFVPEYCMAAMCAQMYCVILAIALFECTTSAKAKIRAERILYLRRFSSLSFSCFVFGFMLSQPIRNMLKIGGHSIQIWGYIGYIVLYFILTLLVHCMFDTMQDKLTPDWMIKRFSHIFSAKGKFSEVSEQHLNVNPVNLFGKLD
ncbi:Transmembrane_domain-containing protein [Hexamita inflata]|uniref:Transmembrane domain-containing protein n=1 Tax=Hexamita inflata TaxID=28002 RepID=A0AA86NWC4_9EUKA|nr:Transmembrane domain-containing protein [Hexamita inflata]